MQSHRGDDHQHDRTSHPRNRPARITAPPIYGNFQRYYHIRNPLNSTAAELGSSNSPHPALAVDSRVSAILRYLRQYFTAAAAAAAAAAFSKDAPPGQDVRVLYIGCNSGKITIEIAQMLPRLLGGCGWVEAPVGVVGVDIDASLIEQARWAADVARSRCRPGRMGGDNAEGSEGGADGEDDRLPADSVYFPSAFPSLYGCIPCFAHEGAGYQDVKPRDVKRRKIDMVDGSISAKAVQRQADYLSPPNLTFLVADFVQPHLTTAHIHLAPSSYTLTLALSITKWIHIQTGDVGLLGSFARIARLLRVRGLLVLERQEWNSYHSAKNLDCTIRSKIKRLKLRPGGDFDYWLGKFGLELEGEVGTGKGWGFERPVQVFRRVRGGEEEDALVERWAMTPLDQLEMVAWVARSAVSARASLAS